MNALVLRLLPSGRWVLLAAPGSQHVATKRGDVPDSAARVTREDLAASGRVPFLSPLSASGGRA